MKNKEIESLLITNDMGKFGLLEGCDKLETNKEIFECIKSVIPNATIIVPTANLNLPNSKKHTTMMKHQVIKWARSQNMLENTLKA